MYRSCSLLERTLNSPVPTKERNSNLCDDIFYLGDIDTVIVPLFREDESESATLYPKSCSFEVESKGWLVIFYLGDETREGEGSSFSISDSRF